MTSIIEIRRTPTTVAYVAAAVVPEDTDTTAAAERLSRACYGITVPLGWHIRQGLRNAPALRQVVTDTTPLPGSLTVRLSRQDDYQAVKPQLVAAVRQYFADLGLSDVEEFPAGVETLVDEQWFIDGRRRLVDLGEPELTEAANQATQATASAVTSTAQALAPPQRPKPQPPTTTHARRPARKQSQPVPRTSAATTEVEATSEVPQPELPTAKDLVNRLTEERVRATGRRRS